MNEELKECPFCGGEAKFSHIFENPDKCMIGCRDCDCTIDSVFQNEAEATTAWNRRATPANPQTWIPVSERLPEHYKAVLVYRSSWVRPVMAYMREDNEFTNNKEVFTPTHWMPLPEPPKEDAE